MTIINESTFSLLILTDTVDLVSQDHAVVSAISLTQSAVSSIKILSTGHILNLTQDADPHTVLASASNSIALNQTLSFIGAQNAPELISQLNLTQTARSSIRVGIASNTIDLTQQLTTINKIIVIDASNSLAGEEGDIETDELFNVDPFDVQQVAQLVTDNILQHSVTVEKVLNLSVTSFIPLSQLYVTANTIELNVISHISLVSFVEKIEDERPISFLTLQHSVTIDIVNPVSNTLSLTQAVTPGAVFPRSLTSELDLKSVVSYYTVDLCNYNLGVGEGDFDVPAPSSIPPTLVRRSTTILTWPFTSPALTLLLRNPDFDNVEQFEARRIVRRTRGGTLDLFRDETWPKTKRFIMNFSTLKDEDIIDLLEFIQKSIGQEIGLLDFESRQWKGIILTPSSATQQPGIDSFGASFEFEGELEP